MRILFLSAAASIHTVKWVNAFAERGNDVYLVYNKGHEPKADSLHENVQCHCLRHSGAIAYYLNAGELSKLEKKIRPDVINVHYASGYGTLARRAKIGPILLSVWGSDVYDFPYESRVKNKILKKNVKYASMLASTSHCMAEQLKKVMDDDELNIHITPFGVDTKKFNPDKYHGIKKNEIVLGNIKALKHKYGIGTFIEGVEILTQRLSGQKEILDKLRVEIYGQGELKEELTQKVREIGLEQMIQFKGLIPNDEVPEKLAGFDVFCAASVLDSESFGVAIVEAMAMQIPVVVTDVDGFKEVVSHNETGIIVKKNKPEEIAKALERLILDSELRKKMGEQGRQRVKHLYDWKNNVDMMQNLYSQLEKIK